MATSAHGHVSRDPDRRLPGPDTNHVARGVEEMAAAPRFAPVPLTVGAGAPHAMAWATPRGAGRAMAGPA